VFEAAHSLKFKLCLEVAGFAEFCAFLSQVFLVAKFVPAFYRTEGKNHGFADFHVIFYFRNYG